MSNAVMAEIWEHSPAKGSDLLLLLAIAHLADDDGFLTATMNTIAEKARMSASTAFRAAKNLEGDGLLEVLDRGVGRAPSRYAVARSAVNLTAQDVDGADRSAVKLTPLRNDLDLCCQSDITTASASAVNLTPQDGLCCQSDTTTDAPVEGTRAGARTEVGREEGTTPTYLPQPTDRAREEPTAPEDGPEADNELAAFISTINFKRALRRSEFERIAALVATKRNHGWTYEAIRDAVGGDLENANSRVAVVTSRLRDLPIAPPAPPRPKRAGRCEVHLLSLPCIGCDADAKARNDED